MKNRSNATDVSIPKVSHYAVVPIYLSSRRVSVVVGRDNRAPVIEDLWKSILRH